MNWTRWHEALPYIYVLWHGYEETKASTVPWSFCESRPEAFQI